MASEILGQVFGDLKNAPDTTPVIPAGDYNGVVAGWQIDTVETQDGERDILRIIITLQGNPGVMLSDNSAPVDGQNVEYAIFLPTEEDKHQPAKFGRGSLYDISIRKIKRFFKVCGTDPNDFNTFEEALDACKGAQVVVSITNGQTDDGTLFDRVSRIS